VGVQPGLHLEPKTDNVALEAQMLRAWLDSFGRLRH
jgi:hypothetical protein